MVPIRILIIDSNFERIKYLKNAVKKSPHEIDALYATLDVNEDVENLVEKNNVELIFLNVRFYGVNTLTIAKNFSKKYPHIKIVYFGEVGDSLYIQQFSKISGIYTYTLPHREQSINKAIETYKTYIANLAEVKNFNVQMYEKTINNKDLFIDKFLNGIVTGAIKNSGEILTSFKHFGIDLKEDYRVLTFRIDHFKKIILTLEENEKHLIISKMKYYISSGFSNIKHVAFFPQLNEVVVISNGLKDLTKAITVAETIKEAVFVEMGLKITIGIGRYYKDINDVYVSYNEAVSASNYRFQLGYGSVIPIEYVEPINQVTHRITNEKKNKLIYTTVMGEEEFSKNQIEKVFKDLLDIKGLPKKYPSKLVHSIIVDVDAHAGAKGVDVDSFYDENVDYNYIHAIKDLKTAENYLLDFIEKFCRYINKLREDEATVIFENAKKFFDEYYYESFSVNKVAIGLSVSGDYLNNLFKRFTEGTAYDYVQRKRIEKAKKFLREENYDDAYVAAQVGFDSKVHFRSIFKMYEKRTTEEYRSQYNVYYATLNKNAFKRL